MVEKESRDILWEKTRQAIIYAYKNHINEYDYFVKADDDTYMIVENLRFMLSTKNPDEAFFMGRRFHVSLTHFKPWINKLIGK